MVKEFIALHNIPECLQGTLREYFAQEQTAAKGEDIESVRKCEYVARGKLSRGLNLNSTSLS